MSYDPALNGVVSGDNLRPCLCAAVWRNYIVTPPMWWWVERACLIPLPRSQVGSLPSFSQESNKSSSALDPPLTELSESLQLTVSH